MKWLALLILAGCAADYTWTRDYPPSREVIWRVVPANQLHDFCGIDRAKQPNLGACAIQIQQTGLCFVFSYFTEHEADRVFAGDGISLKEHELRHCAGERHK